MAGMASDSTRAVELRIAGASFDAIADALELGSADAARDAVTAGMADRSASVRDALTVEVARLDRLLAPVWPLARRGDTDAIETALKISDRRVKALAALAALDDEKTVGPNVLGGGVTPLDELYARRASRGAGTSGTGGPKVATKRRG